MADSQNVPITFESSKNEGTTSLEGQIAFSFALGVLGGVYTYSILYLVVFLIIFELCFFFIYWVWPIKLRISIIVAYLIGLLIGAYCAEAEYPRFI